MKRMFIILTAVMLLRVYVAVPSNAAELPATPASAKPSYEDLLLKANVQFRDGKLEVALAAAEEAHRRDPSRFEAPATRALILHAAGKIHDAKVALEEARQLAPAEMRHKVDNIAEVISSQKGSSVSEPSILDEPTRAKRDALALIVQEADKATLQSERKSLLREFIDKSEPFLLQHPEDFSLWLLRAAAAIELNHATAGWEAGKRLRAMNSGDPTDERLRKIVAMLERRGWLNKNKPIEQRSPEQFRRPSELYLAHPGANAFKMMSPEFVEAVQDLAPVFPIIGPIGKYVPGGFRRLVLNENRVGFGGVRIRNTESAARNLAWMFSFRGDVSFRWNIVPSYGNSDFGFTNYAMLKPEAVRKFAPLDAHFQTEHFNTVLQGLPGLLMEPGREYIIWFAFFDPKPLEMHFAFRLAELSDDDPRILFRELERTDWKGLNAERLAQVEAFLKANSKLDGVRTTASGLQYKVLASGNGKKLRPGESANVHYHGTLVDGSVFDSSIARETPRKFNPAKLMRGFREALMLMREGDHWEIYIPPNLAYGDLGAPPKILPHTPLIYKLQLISVE